MGFTGPQDLSDLHLLSRIASGDAEALGMLYDRHAGRVLGLLVRLIKRRSDAEDLLQETFLRVWRASAHYDSRRSSPVTWLFLIARSRALDYLRRHRIDCVGEVVEATMSHESFEDLEHDELASQLREILGQLPEPQRRAVSLAFFEGLSHTQVAEIQGVPLGTVKTRIRMGLQRLRDILDESQKVSSR